MKFKMALHLTSCEERMSLFWPPWAPSLIIRCVAIITVRGHARVCAVAGRGRTVPRPIPIHHIRSDTNANICRGHRARGPLFIDCSGFCNASVVGGPSWRWEAPWSVSGVAPASLCRAEDVDMLMERQ
jgi:hypothetical protein